MVFLHSNYGWLINNQRFPSWSLQDNSFMVKIKVIKFQITKRWRQALIWPRYLHCFVVKIECILNWSTKIEASSYSCIESGKHKLPNHSTRFFAYDWHIDDDDYNRLWHFHECFHAAFDLTAACTAASNIPPSIGLKWTIIMSKKSFVSGLWYCEMLIFAVKFSVSIKTHWGIRLSQLSK